MSEVEIIARSAGYTIALLAVIAAAIYYGWELRAALALKIESFGITNRKWAEYDEVMKAHKSKLPPLKAQLHQIHERQSDT